MESEVHCNLPNHPRCDVMPEADGDGRKNKQEPPIFIQESSINNFISLFLGDDLMSINDRAGALGNLSTYRTHSLAKLKSPPRES